MSPKTLERPTVYIISDPHRVAICRKKTRNKCILLHRQHDTLHFYFYILANSVKQKQFIYNGDEWTHFFELIHYKMICLTDTQ